MSIHKKSFSEIYASMAADSRVRLPELTDFEEGSVTRSLFESFAYELAVLYEQLDLVYQAGFIDTAAAANLERVVAVLGLKRNEPDFASGLVTFSRDAGAPDEVVVPIGTLVTTVDDPQATPAKKAYLTIEEGRMPPGAVAVDVRVRAEERGKAMAADAATIVVMPRPVPGIKAVTNQQAVRFLGRERETDEELRDRAKQTLLASGRASTTSIENALLSLPDVREVRVHEGFATTVAAPQSDSVSTTVPSLDPTARPGTIEVFVDGMNERNERSLRQRVDEVRAAGIYVILKPAAPINVEAVARIEPDGRLAAAEQTLLEQHVQAAIGDYIDRLKMGQPLLFSQLTSEILAVKGVADVVDLRILTYREVDAFAGGTISLTRSAGLDLSLRIDNPATVRSLSGKQFIIGEAAVLNEGEARLELAVQAVQAGRAGELPQSGALWEPLALGGLELAVGNERPLLLAREAYNQQSRRIASADSERFVAARIRVAANDKPLPLIVQIKLAELGSGPDEKRRAIEAAVGAYFKDLAVGEQVVGADLARALGLPNGEEFALRLVALPFQSSERPEDAAITVSFVERPIAALTFVYRDRVELTGSLQLVLAPTATDAEGREAGVAVRRAIDWYLDDLAPEQDIDLAQINAIAAAHPLVARVVFEPKQCQLYKIGQRRTLQADRNDGKTVKIKSFEKAFLAADAGFVIQA